MFKLFLKMFVLLIGTLLVSFYVQIEILDRLIWDSQRSYRVDFRERFRPTFYFLERELAPLPRAQWAERLAMHREGFTYPVRLATLDQVRAQLIENEQKQRLVEGKIVSFDAAPTLLYIMRRVRDTDAVLVMEFPMTPSVRVQANATNLAVESLFVAAFVWLVILWFWRDMTKLDRAAARVGAGRFDLHVEVSRRSALKPLADTFNAMKDRIAALLGSHRNLTNAISHEFRTPITRLRFRHELAMEAVSLAEKDKQLAAMSSAIDQLDDLSSELLEYARLDRETPQLDIGPIDTVAWLNELADEARDVARAQGRDVSIGVRTGAECADGDYRYLSRAAANLLRNAVRYARQRVELSFERQSGKSVLMVEDDGPGIPVAEREHLFEPFTRLDESRDRESGGFGIGLAIVRQIARWHGGTAAIDESRLGGARVSVAW